MIQRTLILLKPDALERGLAGEILARFERCGLRVKGCRHVVASLGLLESHYAELGQKNPSAFRRTVDDLVGKDFIAVVLEGCQAVVRVRALVGLTDPSEASPGTIRGDYGADTIALADAERRATRNLVHASDSAASAAREMLLWLG